MFYVPMTLALMACNGAGVEEDCWYCTDDSGSEDTDGQDTDGKDTDGKDTDGKDTDGKDTDGKDTDGKDDSQGQWTGSLTPETGLGSFSYVSDVCEVSYPVTKATELTDCSACTLAWEITLDTPEVTLDDNCGDFASYAGAKIPYGHAEPDRLMSSKGGSWSKAGESYFKESLWYFTLAGGGGK
jgi:hypothetical protein